MLGLMSKGNITIIYNNDSMFEIYTKKHILLEYIVKFLNKIDPHPMFSVNSDKDEVMFLEYNNIHSVLLIRYVNNKVIFDYSTHIIANNKNIKIAGSQIMCSKEDLIELI